MGIIQLIVRLNKWRRAQFVSLLLLSLIGALAELATIGSVVPFLALLANPNTKAKGHILGDLLGAVSDTTDQQTLPVAAMLFGALAVGSSCIQLLLGWASVKFTNAVGHDLAMQVYRTTLYRPYTYHVSRNTSDLLAGVENVSRVVGGILTPGLDMVVSSVLSVAILYGLIALDPTLALLSASLFGAIYLAIAGFSRSEVLRNSHIISRATSGRIRAMQEGLGGIRDILLDGSQSIHIRRFQRLDADFRNAQVRNQLWSQLPRNLVEGLGIAIISLLAAMTVRRAGGMADGIPFLGALALGAQRLLPLFQRIYSGWSSIKGNRGIFEDVVQLVTDNLNANTTSVGEATEVSFKRDISLNGLGFRYSDRAPWVFQNVDLCIKRGARIGFAGETGCGKSTLLDVIMGLLNPTAGYMEIDGRRLGLSNIHHWRARIAHVPQAIFLADSSIAANIAFGEAVERIDMTRVEDAAKRAHIHDFVVALEHGYDTPVGERGVRLSGGQRQRIGIARALYRRAEVLVLDEATSALDGATEQAVMESITEIGTDVTVFLVAHRLSTLEKCDFIVEMGRGEWRLRYRSKMNSE